MLEGIEVPAPRNPTHSARHQRESERESLIGSAGTVSGLCPFPGQLEYVSPAQRGA